MVSVSWLGILFFFICVNAGFYVIGQHLLSVGDPMANTFLGTNVDFAIYNTTESGNRTTLYGNFTNLGNYTDGGTGQPFDIFDQAPENVIQGTYTLWQGLPIGNAFTVLNNVFVMIGVDLPYLDNAVANIFGLAFILFTAYMLLGRQPN